MLKTGSLFDSSQRLSNRRINGVVCYYRAGTSDERVLREVVENSVYARKSIAFDVESGERWLDLGANIGSFALYCKIKGAKAVCYEPDPENFAILKKNVPEFRCVNAAVTCFREKRLPFWKGVSPSDHYRATIYPGKKLPRHPCGTLANIYGGFLLEQTFDGVKLDIEGSEMGLFDNELLPVCNKLCMEYHLSRDPSVSNLKRRLEFLRKRFNHVRYPPEYDRFIEAGGDRRSFFDRMVYCWN